MSFLTPRISTTQASRLLTPAQAADLLKVDLTTVRTRLLARPPQASPLEAGEFRELPHIA